MSFCNPVCFRFTVLIFTSLLSFGAQFCYDMPSVLQKEFQNNDNCTMDTNLTMDQNSTVTCCSDCLGLTGPEYNSLFAMYSWMSAVFVIISGILLDKFGNRIGAFSSTLLCVVSVSVFAWGAMLRGTQAMLPVMLLGRALYAIGYGYVTVAQYRLICFWFAENELSLAYGLNWFITRLASVVNFFVTAQLYNTIGLVATLWIGVLPCLVSFLSAFVLIYLDTTGTKKLNLVDKVESDAAKFKITDIKHFSSTFWILSSAIMFIYSSVMPFLADSSKFIQDKFYYDPVTSAYISGATYFTVVILSPFMGILIDFIGKRGYLGIFCNMLTILAFILLTFAPVHPLVSTILLGLMFAICNVAMFPCVVAVVSSGVMGTANGILLSMQLIGMGLSNIIVGFILGEASSEGETLIRWQYVMVFLLANAFAGLLFSILLNIQDRRKNCGMNLSMKQVKEKTLGASQNTIITSINSVELTKY